MRSYSKESENGKIVKQMSDRHFTTPQRTVLFYLKNTQ